MKTKVLTSTDTDYEIICDYFLGTEIDSVEDIFKTILELKNKFPGHSVLVTLDDLGQAQYTSMHSTLSHDLDDIEGHDLSYLNPLAFENGDHIGFLFTKSEFFIREKNFISKTGLITFSDVCEEALTIDDNEIAVLEKVHADPLKYIDKEILIKGLY